MATKPKTTRAPKALTYRAKFAEFLAKCDSEGLAYAILNYAPDTDDDELRALLEQFSELYVEVEAAIDAKSEEYGLLE